MLSATYQRTDRGGRADFGRFSVETANQLAISLRSGALPVDLAVIEERTVGPDLGADSIKRGMLAMGVGSLLVILLMIASYGRFGVYATVALVINAAMLLGIMAALSTTLTLPGIAGFVLTIGAAVDANVLINERIREERKRGRRVIAAVENGYNEQPRDLRRQHHQLHCRRCCSCSALNHPRLRGGADHRAVHQRLHCGHADRCGHKGCASRKDIARRAGKMKLLKLSPDDTNIAFLVARALLRSACC